MESKEYKRYIKAKKKVQVIKGFWQHVTIFVLVTIAIYITRFVVLPKMGIISEDEDFDRWLSLNTYAVPLIWLVVLFFHGLSVFGPDFKRMKEWEERKIREFMDEEGNSTKEND